MKTKQEMKQELLVKEQRVSYWEKFGIVANRSDLLFSNDLNKVVGV